VRLIIRLGAVTAAVIAGWWAMREWVVRPVACNAAITRLTGSSMLAEKDRDRAEGQLMARRNLEALREIQGDCSTNINLYMLIALNEQIAGDRSAALRAYDQALTLDERPEIHSAKAPLLLEEGRVDEAAREWATAIQMAPRMTRGVPEALRQDVERLSGVQIGRRRRRR
jgi:tetratricopeptide (TPR) repeat protein